jgi:hypothetical protein
VNDSKSPIICKSPKQIDEFMGKNKFSMIFKNNYFDFKSYGNEIKTYIDESVFIEGEA